MEMDKILIENLVSEYGLPIHKVALDNICKDLNGSGQNSAELKECCMCKRTRQCYKSTADQWYCQECINSLFKAKIENKKHSNYCTGYRNMFKNFIQYRQKYYPFLEFPFFVFMGGIIAIISYAIYQFFRI